MPLAQWAQQLRVLQCTRAFVQTLESDINMPSKSQAQERLMAAAAHNPKFAKKVGVPTKVAKEFNKADTGVKLKSLPKRVSGRGR